MKPQSRSKLVFTIIGMALASLVVFSIVLSLFAVLATQNRPSNVAIGPPPPRTAENCPIPLETWTIHGKGKSSETHVPFHLSAGNEILVEARINGKPIECMVDTGCSDILWNSELVLTKQRTGLQAAAYDAAQHTVTIQESLLDRIQIGGLELRQMPSYAVVSATAQASHLPILGNSVFAHTVLTIDYAKQELIIRSPSSNDKPFKQRKNDHVIDFEWGSPNVRGRFGSPCIRGSILSRPATFMVDSGWCGPTVAFTHRFYNHVLPKFKTRKTKTGQAVSRLAFGESRVTTLSCISWSFGGITAISPAAIVVDLGPKAQAVFGYDTLRHFKTTIDYPHQKIRFQPN